MHMLNANANPAKSRTATIRLANLTTLIWRISQALVEGGPVIHQNRQFSKSLITLQKYWEIQEYNHDFPGL